MMRIIIIGAGGHGKVVLDTLLNSSNIVREKIELIAFLDDDPAKKGRYIFNVPVLGTTKNLHKWLSEYEFNYGIVAIGDNIIRARYFFELIDIGIKPLTIIHRNAIVSPFSRIGKGTVVVAGAVINSDARIGNNVIINTAATIDHDCTIEDHSTINPGAHLAGNVRVGNFSYIHTGAIILPNKKVGNNAIVGAGAVVINDVPDNYVVVGVPAKFLRYNKDRPDQKLLEKISNAEENL